MSSESAAVPTRLPAPIPAHLMGQGWTEERFVVLEYQDPPGWWRRLGHYRDRATALSQAAVIAKTGTAVVLRQVVHEGPMTFITCLGSEADK